MQGSLKIAIVPASQVRKVKQLNDKRLAEFQFDSAF